MALLNKIDYIRKFLIEHSLSVSNTIELQNFNYSFEDVVEENFVDYNEYNDLALIYDYIQENLENDNRVVGHYIIDKYTFINNELEYVVSRFQENGIETRQAVIAFPREHCFESIQFMVRNRKMVTIVNMRSCNFEANFVGDIYLAYRLSKTIINSLSLDKIEGIDIHMNIGSLHIFDKDYQVTGRSLDRKTNTEKKDDYNS